MPSPSCTEFLTIQVDNQWNRLPHEVIGSSSLEIFKQRLYSHLHRFTSGSYTEQEVGVDPSNFILYFAMMNIQKCTSSDTGGDIHPQ